MNRLAIGLFVLLLSLPLANYSQSQELELEATKLLEKLNGPEASNDQKCREIIRQIEKIGPEANCAIPKLTWMVVNRRQKGLRVGVAEPAIRALLSMGKESSESIAHLLRNENKEVQRVVLNEMADFNALDTAELKPDLLLLLANRDELSHLALRVLLLRPDNRRAVYPQVLEDLSEPDPLFLCGNWFSTLEVKEKLRDLALKHAQPGCRIRAAALLTSVDPEGTFSLPVLVEQLNDEESEGGSGLSGAWQPAVCQEAKDRLIRHPARVKVDGEKLTQLVEALDFEERTDWWELLAECQVDEAIELVQRDFQHARALDRRLAVDAASSLVRLSDDNLEALEFLTSVYEDEKLSGRIVSAGKVGFPISIRLEAARALGNLRIRQYRNALPLLRKGMSHSEATIRGGKEFPSDLAARSAWSLAKLDRMDPESVRFLVTTKKLPFEFSNFQEEDVLGKESADSFARILGNRMSIVEEQILDLAFKFDNGKGKPLFAQKVLMAGNRPRTGLLVQRAFQVIEGEKKGEVAAARNVLLGLGKKLVPHFELICKKCESSNYESRKMAVSLIGRLKHKPGVSIPILIKACRDTRVLVRCRAAEGLGAYGQQAEAALPQLRELVGDRFLSVEKSAWEAIQMISSTK